MNYLLLALKADILLIISAFGSVIFALSDAVLGQMIASATTIGLGLVAAYFSYKSKRSSERAEKAVNGITHEMIARAEVAAKAVGKLEGKEEAEVVAAQVIVATDAAKQIPKP